MGGYDMSVAKDIAVVIIYYLSSVVKLGDAIGDFLGNVAVVYLLYGCI